MHAESTYIKFIKMIDRYNMWTLKIAIKYIETYNQAIDLSQDQTDESTRNKSPNETFV